MSNTIPPLTPDLHSLATCANFQGISPEHALANYFAEKTGGVRTESLDKLDARRTKAQAELARIADEEARQLGIAAHRNALASQLSQLRERFGKQGYNEGLAGELLLGHLNQSAIASAMEPLVAELET